MLVDSYSDSQSAPKRQNGMIVVIIFLTIIESRWLNKEEKTDERGSFK